MEDFHGIQMYKWAKKERENIITAHQCFSCIEIEEKINRHNGGKVTKEYHLEAYSNCHWKNLRERRLGQHPKLRCQSSMILIWLLPDIRWIIRQSWIRQYSGDGMLYCRDWRSTVRGIFEFWSHYSLWSCWWSKGLRSIESYLVCWHIYDFILKHQY